MVLRFKIILFLLFTASLMLFLADFSPAAIAQTEVSDAIGMRTIANKASSSPLKWYRDNIKIPGSPQSIIIDGYDAVRDGRSVYATIGNVGGTDPNWTLYLNLAILSYNQSSKNATVDIFGQLLKRVKFNRNVGGLGLCSEDQEKVCSVDSDCLGIGLCFRRPGGPTPKAEVIRDVRRLTQLADLRGIIENAGHYPRLESGTYLPNKTISVWPSWKMTLEAELGTELPLDPVNKMGPCAGFSADTCWDETNKTFAAAYPDLPPLSHAFLYFYSPTGGRYNVCAVMESGLIPYIDSGLSNGACPGSAGTFIPDAANHAPWISTSLLSAVQGQPFAGSIRAFDPEGDQIIWSVDTTLANWSSWYGSAPPAITGSLGDVEVRLNSQLAGTVGTYPIRVTISDGSGAAQTVNLDISVTISLCTDLDGDGYGNPASTHCRHSQLDCDDSVLAGANVNPGANEAGFALCTDGIDNDCDGLRDAQDPGCTPCDRVCNGICRSSCASGDDPDCNCLSGNQCCGRNCAGSGAGMDSNCAAACGNSVCESGEDCITCSRDCGSCANPCGDGYCDTSAACNECDLCPADCSSTDCP
jgi:hypothetical protein